jgi:flagellar hook-length control protein FliK
MNVAASNATPLPSPTRVDTSQASAPADDGAENAAPTDPSSPQGFGQILSKNMAKDAQKDDAQSDARQAAGGDKRDDPAATSTDAASARVAAAGDVNRGVRMMVPQDLYPTITSMRGVASKDTAQDGTDAAKAKGDDDGDAAGNDLAAQLALVSQWAGIAPPATTAVADRAAANGDALDIKGKLDTLRSTTGKATADKATIATAKAETVDLGQVPGAVLPSAMIAAGQTADRNTRATTPLPISTAVAKTDGAKADGPRTQDVSRPTSVDSLTTSMDKLFALASATTQATPTDTTSIDKLFAIAGARAQGTPTDATSMASAFVTQVAAQVSSAQASIAPTPNANDMLREPVGTPAWSHEVGHAALRMAANDLQNASLHLNPEHLGPLEVQMRVDNGVAHLQFTATHAETRQALESSRTTLDQMFSNQGIKLGDWSVGHSSSDGAFARDFGTASSQGDGGNRQGSRNASTGGDDIVTATVTTRTTRALGLVDTFA